MIHRHWDAMALIKILDFPGARGINIDNSANTPINEFDGNVDALRKASDPFMVDPKPLMDRMGGTCTFMPGVGARQQLGASVRSPAISTTQARQLPSGRRPSA